MKNDCEEIRRKMAESIGCGMEQDKGEEIKNHCAACESCRRYRDRLLRDDAEMAELASSEAQAVRSVEQRTIDAISKATPIRGRRARFTGTFSRTSRIAAIAATAAATVVLLVAIDFIRGAHNGAVPAFAAVQEKMQKYDSVIHRERSWALGQWTTCVRGNARGGILRKDYGDSIVVLDHRNRTTRESILRIYPAEKRAVLFETVYEPQKRLSAEAIAKWQGEDVVDRLGGLYKLKGFSFVRKEHREARNMAVYEQHLGKPGQESTWKVWVDLDTELPARVEIVFPSLAPKRELRSCGLRLNDFVPEGTAPAGWVDLKPGEPSMIWDDFRWAESTDTSYFSLVPPAGFRLETHREVIGDQPRGYGGSRELVHALSTWLSLSGNVFPDDIHDLMDSTKVKSLLLAKFRRGGDPVEEFRAAYRPGAELWDYAGIVEILDSYHVPSGYFGKGVAFGDPKKIVCWFKYENDPCFIIYADLHIATAVAPPTPARE